MKFKDSPSGINYLPISAVAEIYYCPRNFYYRFVEKVERLISAWKREGSRRKSGAFGKGWNGRGIVSGPDFDY